MDDGRPRLRADLVILQQVFRGQQSTIVKDRAGGRFFRFGRAEATVLSLLDGERTAAQVAEELAVRGLRVSAGGVAAFARKLGQAGLLERTLHERTTLELERTRAERTRRRRARWLRGELLRLRWSFGDPDALFERTMPWLRWCFTREFLAASVALFAIYAAILLGGWRAFAHDFASVYSPRNLTLGAALLFWVTGLVVILVHELGHGYTCKWFGGEVREMGFMLLYVQPAFYCNVNDAWSFPELRARLWVTVAGTWIQLVAASVAAIAWWTATPHTLVWEAALAAMAMGGFATILTNANPLLPLDGYFALSDWLDIPNLRFRARAHLGWWLRRHVMGVELPEPRVTDRERRVFLLYGALATAYSVALLLLTATLLVGWTGRLAGGLAATVLLVAIAALVWRRARGLLAALRPMTREAIRRWRASPRSRRLVLVAVAMLAALGAAPWPLRVRGTARATPVARWTLVAADSGIVAQVMVREGDRVQRGAPLMRLRDAWLEHEEVARALATDSLDFLVRRARAEGGGEASRLEAERDAAAARLGAVRARLGALVIRAPGRGVVVSRWPEERLGQRLVPGDPVLEIADADAAEARATLRASGALLVRGGEPLTVVPLASGGPPLHLRVASVAALGTGSAAGVEVRAPLPAAREWPPGATGEATVRLGRTTIFGALLREARERVRTDLLL